MNDTFADWPSMLAENELDELDRILRANADEQSLLLDGVHGFLTAMAIGPVKAIPEQWLSEVMGQHIEDDEEKERARQLLACLVKSIPVELRVHAYQPILGEIGSHDIMDDPDTPVLTAAGWCEGFSRGVDLHAGLWEKRLSEDPQLMQLLGPIVALAVDEGVLRADVDIEQLTEDEYDHCLSRMPRVLDAVADYWRLRAPSEEEREEMANQREYPVVRSRHGHWLH